MCTIYTHTERLTVLRMHAHTDTHKHTFLCTHERTRMHTHKHTQLVLVLVFTSQTGYVVQNPNAWGEPSGGNNTGNPIGSRHASFVLILLFTTPRSGYVAPIQRVSQQEAARLVVPLVAASSPQLSHTHTAH